MLLLTFLNYLWHFIIHFLLFFTLFPFIHHTFLFHAFQWLILQFLFIIFYTYLHTNIYPPIHPIPFFGHFLNISTIPYQTYRALENSLIYFLCSHSQPQCSEWLIDNSGISGLNSKHFNCANLICRFFFEKLRSLFWRPRVY